VLGKQQAAQAGAYEAWQVDEVGCVTEGCSSNAWIVTTDGILVTRQIDHLILCGVTRQSVLKLAQINGVAFEERPFTVTEAFTACEAFLTAASNFVMPVTRIDGKLVGNGKPGELTIKMRHLYENYTTNQYGIPQ
jgi:D-alanine transaminase